MFGGGARKKAIKRLKHTRSRIRSWLEYWDQNFYQSQFKYGNKKEPQNLDNHNFEVPFCFHILISTAQIGLP